MAISFDELKHLTLEGLITNETARELAQELMRPKAVPIDINVNVEALHVTDDDTTKFVADFEEKALKTILATLQNRTVWFDNRYYTIRHIDVGWSVCVFSLHRIVPSGTTSLRLESKNENNRGNYTLSASLGSITDPDFDYKRSAMKKTGILSPMKDDDNFNQKATCDHEGDWDIF